MNEMEIVGIICIVIVGLILYSIYCNRINEKRLLERLKNEWGIEPTTEFTSEKFDAIQEFYLNHQDEKLDVDDITWNDLDMDEIYKRMNNTQSSIGEEYLYFLLRKPCFSQEELNERNRLIEFFQTNPEARLKLQHILFDIGKLSSISIYRYINRLDDLEVKSNLPHYLMILSVFCSVGIIFVYPPIGGVLTLATVVHNVYRYYQRKAQIEHYLVVFSYILRLLDSVKQISNTGIPEFDQYLEPLKKDHNTFQKFKRGAILLTPKKATGSFIELMLDYWRLLFHMDLIKFNNMLRTVKENREGINRMFHFVGKIDAYIGVASFREMIPYYSLPKLNKDKNPWMKAEELYHPLLKDPVVNSITQDQSALITGSNASGKSTFIKTLAINGILSQTVYTSTSKSYEGSFFMIYSSMALRDNIFSNESYYIVEIKSLKRIFERLNGDIPILCFVDEVLRGTNTLERIAASSRILYSLAEDNALVFAATHDIELTHILENRFTNYHFQERIEDRKILFDYRLYEGRAISKNAIKLLDMLGFSKTIIDGAEKAAEEFLSSGEWNNLKN